MNNVSYLRIDHEIVRDASALQQHDAFADPHNYIRDVNAHLANLVRRTSDIPAKFLWDVVSPEKFKTATAGLSARGQIGAFWLDQSNQALAYAALVGWKTQSLIGSFVRTVNARELFGAALVGRAILELTAATIVQIKEPLGAFQTVGKSDKPVLPEPEVTRRIEETLIKAIWGTRIGTSEIKPGVPAWSATPYEAPPSMATNVMTFMQKFAREFGDEGATALRVYEWLSDIVHPATQGFRVFWESTSEIAPGHRRFVLRATGAESKDQTIALALWAAGCSAVVLRHTLEHLSEAVACTQRKLPDVYGLKRR